MQLTSKITSTTSGNNNDNSNHKCVLSLLGRWKSWYTKVSKDQNNYDWGTRIECSLWSSKVNLKKFISVLCLITIENSPWTFPWRAVNFASYQTYSGTVLEIILWCIKRRKKVGKESSSKFYPLGVWHTRNYNWKKGKVDKDQNRM